MNGRNSTVLTVRLPDEKVKIIKRRAEKMGITVNAYIIYELTRSHKRNSTKDSLTYIP